MKSDTRYSNRRPNARSERPARDMRAQRTQKEQTVQLTVRGMARGAIRMEAEDGTIYTCAKENARGALFGDTVLAERIGRDRVIVAKVLTHAHENIMGVLRVHDGVRVIQPLERRLPAEIAVADLHAEAEDGEIVRTIVEDFNRRGLKTKSGKPFSPNSFNRILKNRKYIGEYQYQDVVIPGGVPAILSDDLFYRVQARLEKNKRAPATAKADVDYLLTTKLFCGICERMMIGESGTSHTGDKHYYYKCAGAKRKLGCKKKSAKKDFIERAAVVLTVNRVLKDEEIDRIADGILTLQASEDTTIPALKKQLADTERGIENMLNAIQKGVLTSSTKERLEALEKQRDNLKIAVLQAELQKPKYTKEQIVSWIGQFKYGDVNSREYQKRIIDTFVNSLYLFDDRLVITYNFKGGTETITLKDVEAAYGSDLKAVSPPQTLRTDMVQRVFCYVTAHPSLLFLDKIRLCSYYNYC